MHTLAKVAALVVTSLALTLGGVQAGPVVFVDYTPIDITPPIDNTPVDVIPDIPDAPPLVDPVIPYNDDLNDVILGDDEDDKDQDDKVGDVTLILACKIVDGDLVLTNKGDAIPPGAKVKWYAAGLHGTVVLPNGLHAGQKAKIENVVSLDGGKCTAEIV